MKLSQCKDQKELFAFTRHELHYYIVNDQAVETSSSQVKIEYADGGFKGVVDGRPPCEFYTKRQEAEQDTPHERHVMVKLVNPGIPDLSAKILKTEEIWAFEVSESLDDFHLKEIRASIKTLTGWAKGQDDVGMLKKVLKEMARLVLMANLNRHMSIMDIPYDELRKIKDNYILQDEQIQRLE